MPDYQKGIIYKIVALNCENPDEDYYGSTTQGLAKRMGKHRTDYKQWKEGKRDSVTSFNLFETYGIENCKIILVENCFCNNSNELKAKEANYILSNKCVNRNIPNRTRHEWRLDNIEHVKEHDKIRKMANKDERKKTYEEKKQHKFLCKCGGMCIFQYQSRLFQTKMHQTYLLNHPEQTTP